MLYVLLYVWALVLLKLSFHGNFTTKRMVTVCVKCKATMSTVYVCGNF